MTASWALGSKDLGDRRVPLLQHLRAARDLAQADVVPLGDLPLRHSVEQILEEAPAEFERGELFRREKLDEEPFRLPNVAGLAKRGRDSGESSFHSETPSGGQLTGLLFLFAETFLRAET